MKTHFAKVCFLCLFFSSQALYSIVYIFGDSHTREFNGIQGCEIKYLGPILMHRIGRDSLEIIDLKSHGVEEGSTVVYVFGEIDVRCHIIKQRDLKNRDLHEIIDSLARNYIATILENQSRYRSLQSIIYNVVPPTHGDFNSDYPIYGSLEDRVKATKCLNATLKSLAKMNGIMFLDVYRDYEDKDGSLRPELSDGNVHINSNYNGRIREQLWQLLNK